MRHYISLLLCALGLIAGSAPFAQAGLPKQPGPQIVIPAASLRVFLPFVVVPGTTPDTFSGEGTYYDASGAGNCSFDATPGNLMVTALNLPDYGVAQLCGAFVEVTGPKGVVVVRIVDKCPECKSGDLDLSREAFARIAEPIAGRVPISWRVVSPALSGSISYRFKEGSNPYWTAVQIRNHRNPIAKFEYRRGGGTWREVARTDYNYFVDTSGMGTGPYDFRVTDIYGNSLTDSGIALADAAEVAGKGQFPAKP